MSSVLSNLVSGEIVGIIFFQELREKVLVTCIPRLTIKFIGFIIIIAETVGEKSLSPALSDRRIICY